MTVFHKAWAFLKASRQTELGEFHPAFPSSYGPMTMVSLQPTRRQVDTWRANKKISHGNFVPKGVSQYSTFNENYAQPYESFIHQGLIGKPPSQRSIEWDNYHKNHEKNIKQFNFKEGDTGNWFRPAIQRTPKEQVMLQTMGHSPSPHKYTPTYGGLLHGESKMVGVRMPLDESMGMFRDKGYHGENAEAFIYGDIPPERLVMVPYVYDNEADVWPGGLGRVDQ